MARPKSQVLTRRLEIRIPVVVFEAMVKHQQDRERLGIETTLQGTVVAALREMLAIDVEGEER